MSKVIDMTGQRWGKLVVLERAENDPYGKAQWLCQCDCGNQKIIAGASLRKGVTISCGCHRLAKIKQFNEQNTINEIGHRYGKLVVISKNTDSKLQQDGRAMWNCKCDCGNECVVMGKLLRNGHVNSCGCGVKSKGELKIEQILKQLNINWVNQYKVNIAQNQYETQQEHPYYFDFAIIDNNKLHYLIEYDGEQHFSFKENTDYWNNKENFQQTQQRDMIKNQWCKNNNIPLIRIPYTQYDKLCIDDLQLNTSQFLI